MIDRNARNQLATLIRRYLDEEITPLDFIIELCDDFHDSDDTVIRFVFGTFFYSYGAAPDELVASKWEWGYIQRLLLLLDSNSTVTIKHSSIWSLTQLVAAALLMACLFIVMQTGFGYHLLIYIIPLGIGSILLTHFRRPEIQNNPYREILMPFQSINDLHIAYESVNFVKRRHPRHLKSRRLRSPAMDVFISAYSLVSWVIFSPIVLLLQCFPHSNTDIRVYPA